MHFERMADEYARARPPYSRVLFEALAGLGVIGPCGHVLEVGAGSGLATRDLVAAGCQVTALEPGERLARRLFSTFSSWTPAEIEAAATAADRCGGRVTEHYRSILHVLEATPGH